MFWDKELIRKVLNLYKEYPVLWDVKSSHQSEVKALKQEALNEIQNILKLPLTADDIHRKYKTMRAAYQVELRNINAAKMRGFFYKPTLHWFDVYDDYMNDIAEMKATEQLECKKIVHKRLEATKKEAMKKEDEVNTLYSVQERQEIVNKEKKEPQQRQQSQKILEALRKQGSLRPVQDEQEPDPSSEDDASEESGDEFQSFADHIAEQLRSMSVHRAVMIQNKIQRIFAMQRENNEEDF